jgi:parallel beta-helix repeat protein
VKKGVQREEGLHSTESKTTSASLACTADDRPQNFTSHGESRVDFVHSFIRKLVKACLSILKLYCEGDGKQQHAPILGVQEETSTASVAVEESMLMSGKNRAYLFAIALGFFLVLGSMAPVIELAGDGLKSADIIPGPERGGFHSGTPHAPIIIVGDVNFRARAQEEGWPGNGTSEDPIIIEGLDIDTSGAPTYGISISNTQVHFIIRNCNLTGASGSPFYGINLDNVKNCALINNTCTSNSYGIYFTVSDFNTVMNNTCTGNNYGIFLDFSDFNTVANNTCTGNSAGIRISISYFNTVANNTCTGNSDGVYLDNSDSNTVVKNSCTSNNMGIHLGSSDFNTVVNNTCNGNRDGIFIDNSNSNTVANNTCTSNNINGICVTFSYFNTVANNTCTSNFNGVYVWSADSNTVVKNTCTSNTYGIYLTGSDSNTVANNTCTSNHVGVRTDGSSNINDIQWNVLTNSALDNGFDEGASNVYDHNYWSDYAGIDANGDGFGDAPYTFDFNSDPHPLMFLPTPPTWTETPVDQIIEIGTFFRYDLNATAPAPMFWSVDDTTRFTIDSQGVIASIGILYLGNYKVRVTVANIYGFSISAGFNLQVVLAYETEPPGWVITPVDLELAYGEGVDLQIPALDPSGIDHWILNDAIHFSLDATYYELGSTARITNNSVLEPATYGLNISVFDTFENSLSAVFAVTVESPEPDTSPPAWVTLRICQTIEYGEAFQMQVVAWDESGIDHWWLNDTIHFALDENGVICNASVLDPGLYGLEVRAYDPYDNYCSAMLLVAVLEAPSTTVTTTPTSPTTSAIGDGLNSVMTLALGAGIGAAAVLAFVFVLFRRKF